MDEDAVQVQWRQLPAVPAPAPTSAPAGAIMPAPAAGGSGFVATTPSRLVAFPGQDDVRGLRGTAGRGMTVIGIAGQEDRDQARHAIRVAILAELGTLSGLPPERISLHAEPAEAPYALLAAPEGKRQVWLAISHDGELSVAAISLHGAVGIDVTRVIDIPDWEPVARDYLGPEVATALAALAPPARAAAFARAWSQREARLKCLGWPIAEWKPDAEPLLQACRCSALALPEGYVGALSFPPR